MEKHIVTADEIYSELSENECDSASIHYAAALYIDAPFIVRRQFDERFKLTVKNHPELIEHVFTFYAHVDSYYSRRIEEINSIINP